MKLIDKNEMSNNLSLFRMRHPCRMLVSEGLIHPITTGMHKGAGKKKHEAGLTLVIP